MKKNYFIIGCMLCILLIGCRTDPVPTPEPEAETTDTIVNPDTTEEDPCDPVCDSCPPSYFNHTGWFQYFEEPVVINGLNHDPTYQDHVHAIFMRDDWEGDTMGFVNEDIIPECLRKEEKCHVKVCWGIFTGAGNRRMGKLSCIKKEPIIHDPDTPDDEPCEPVCDSCPPEHSLHTGWFQYFENPIMICGLNHNPMVQDHVHAIFMRDDWEGDTMGFVNEDIIPECLRREEKCHVKVCWISLLGTGQRKMGRLYCIEKNTEK